jgi:hypothetical protein
MSAHIYTDMDSPAAVAFADVTILPNTHPDAGRFILVPSANVLFPEAANDLGAATELKGVLEGMKEEALADSRYVPPLDAVRRFGIQKGAEEVVEHILGRYAQAVREQPKLGPGVQYNFHGLTEEGVETTLGNYGLFFATLIAASRDPDYKAALIEAGENVFGNRHGFFVNPPATNAVVECPDGYLFAVRGATGEYPYMLHQIAAGHHFPDKTLPGRTADRHGRVIIPLDELVGYQVSTEVGAGAAPHVQDIKMLGIAFSSGNQLPGTEKVEVLTSAYIAQRAADIWESIKGSAHNWETKSLLRVPKEGIEQFMDATEDKEQPFILPSGVQRFGAERQLGTDRASASYWVPVGLAGLLALPD